MSDPAGDGKRPGSGADQRAGVLGNLPHSRPSVRSPRRATPEAAGASADEAATSEAEAAEAAAGASSQAELEALARSGLAIAGGAASLGLRLAGRAAAAVRDAVERR